MQIRGERSGWKAVKFKPDAPEIAITYHYLWTLARTERIRNIQVTFARNCTLIKPAKKATLMALIKVFK